MNQYRNHQYVHISLQEIVNMYPDFWGSFFKLIIRSKDYPTSWKKVTKYNKNHRYENRPYCINE